MQLARDVYGFTTHLPANERFGLVSQMGRAAVSLPSNVAEGFRRRNAREFAQFLHITLGSAAELETQIELAGQIHSLAAPEVEALIDSLDHFQSITMNLIKQLRGNPPDRQPA